MGKRPKEPVLGRRDFLKKGAAISVGATALGGLRPIEGQAGQLRFDRVADVVVIGAGTSGLAASVRARDGGASVITVDSNFDIGGHGMLSGGGVVLGGGTSLQKKFNIQDSADQIFLDHTSPDRHGGRYNDREIVRAFADNNVSTFEFLLANGVRFFNRAPQVGTFLGGIATIPRTQTTFPATGGLDVTIAAQNGSGLVRALEASARKKGVEFLLLHKMTSIIRESPTSGRVLGITATHNDKTLNIRAKKAVIVATGGHSGNVEFRRMFDPRLTEEYQQAGDPWTVQNAEGERAALAIGASIWGTANQTDEYGNAIRKCVLIGCRSGYGSISGTLRLKFLPESPAFKRAGAMGLGVSDWQDVILVNLLGQRFWDETDSSYDFLAAALGSVVLDGGKARVGGPIWAIFDSDAVTREKWNTTPPDVDLGSYFFSGNTLAELAGKLTDNRYQKRPMSANTLQESVDKYNSFVDAGKDAEFNKPIPKYKIQTPPFYAAWATPILHDTLAGLRVNGKYQVVDHQAQVIAGLYCVGESAGGFDMHGLGKCLVAGYIAGGEAAQEL
jgi:urocanate reductase